MRFFYLRLLATALPAQGLRLGAAAWRVPSVRAPARAAVRADGDTNVAELATKAIDQVLAQLGDGVEPPPSIGKLKALALEDGAPEVLSETMFLLLIERTLEYDTSESGKLEPTKTDYSAKPDAMVAEKLGYAYTYGIAMFKQGLISADFLKSAVLERLAGRIGMTGEEFDEFLAMPAVEV